MPIKLLTTFLVFAFSLSIQAQEKELPKELDPYLLQGYEMLDFGKGDLNGDKLQDYILIMKTKGEDTITFENPEWEAARPVLLLLRQPGGGLKAASTSTSVIQ